MTPPMLPDYITAYLDEQGVPTGDPLATFAALRLDALDMQTIAMLIEEHHGCEIPDAVHERWNTLADIAECVSAYLEVSKF